LKSALKNFVSHTKKGKKDGTFSPVTSVFPSVMQFCPD